MATKSEMILTRWAHVDEIQHQLYYLAEACKEDAAHAAMVEAMKALDRARDAYRADYEEATRPVAALAAIHRHGHRAEG